MTWDEWRATYGFEPVDRDLDQAMSPGGESVIGFARRVIAALDGLLAEHAGQLITFVVHGGVIFPRRCCTCSASTRRRSAEAGRSGSIPRTRRSRSATRDDGSGRWTLSRYNDAAHVEGLAVRSGMTRRSFPGSA